MMVEPSAIDPHTIKERITSALKEFRFRDKGVLVQFWSPVAVRNRWLLTTWDQPFGIGGADEGLYSFRLKSELHAIVADVEDIEELRPPGRVYSQKLPEWSLEVDGGGKKYGYIDLPVFESSSDSCVGVLEIITSSNYVDYAFEVQEVSRALKNQNLKSPRVFEDPTFCVSSLACTLSPYLTLHSCSSFIEAVIGKSACQRMNLPSTVRTLTTWDFLKFCRERHLVNSQGVVGRSFSSRGSWFCRDLTELDEDNYPLVLFAHVSGLTSCLAIYITSLELGVEYVIEFFLPTRSTDDADVQRLMKSVKQHIQNASCMQLDVMSAPQVIGGHPILSWDLESPPLPITLLTEKDVPQDSEDIEEDNIENEPSNSLAVGTSQSIAPYLEHGIGNFDTNPGTVRKKRKRKRSESSITLEEIEKHFGKTMDDAAAILNISRSTLKRICRNRGIARWPYRIGTDKPDSLMKSDQTDIVVHTSDGSLAPVVGVSSEPLGTTTTHDPAPLTEKGKHVSPIRTNPPDETIVASRVENVVIKATYGKNTVKFSFRILDGLIKLKELIATRFQLKHESFRLKYRDEDGDMILILCDNDISHAILSTSEPSSSKAVINLFVQPVGYQSSDA
ncbi:NIN-like protein [Tanacetum coccineum]